LKVIINNVLKGDLSHFHYNTFKVLYSKKNYPPDYYSFQMNNEGKVNAVTIGGIIYKRK
jgi:hypothetical protein